MFLKTLKKNKTVYIKKICKNRILVGDAEVLNHSLSNSVKIIKGKDSPSSNINYDFLFKISLIGDRNTGKTSIQGRYIVNNWNRFFDYKVGLLELVPDIYGKINIWDTPWN